MKYKIGLAFILFPVFAFAQSRATIDSTARSVVNNLINSWTLGIDSTSETVDINVYNTFKNLFDPNATIDDGFNVLYIYDVKKKSGTYQVNPETKPKTFDVYAHDVALQVRSVTIDSVATLDFNTSDRKNIIFTVRRRMKFQKARQYVLPGNLAEEVVSGRTIEFENKTDSLKMVYFLKTKINKNPGAIYEFASINTLRIVMAYETDSVRITNIKSIVNEVVCTNDVDNDAILNGDDSLMNKPGDFTAGGKPDYDLDGLSDENDKCRRTYGDIKNKGCPPSYFLTKNEFDGYAGWQSNSAKIGLPLLNQLGYRDSSGRDLIDSALSNKGILHNSGRITGIYAGANFIHYFGQKKKQSGISAGFSYSGFTAEYRVDKSDPIVYTFKAYDSFNAYRRRITIDSLKEEIKYSILNFPVLFNYRMHVSKKHKAVIKLQAGPSLMIFSNISSYNSTVDLEGLYQIDLTQSAGKITYLERFDPASTSNLLFTIAEISKRGGIGVDSVFKLLGPNYDFGRNKSYSGKQPVTRIAIAANLNLDLQYKVSEGLTIKFGPHFVYASYLPIKTKYKPINRTTDVFQSVYKANTLSSYSAYGMSIGFVYDF